MITHGDFRETHTQENFMPEKEGSRFNSLIVTSCGPRSHTWDYDSWVFKYIKNNSITTYPARNKSLNVIKNGTNNQPIFLSHNCQLS